MLRHRRTQALGRLTITLAALGLVTALQGVGAGTTSAAPLANDPQTSTVEDRLAALGYALPDVPAPLASYVPAVKAGHFVYTSGQLPFVNGALPVSGKVGAEVSVDDAARMAEIAAVNAIAAIKSVVGDLDRVTRVVKVVGYVASAPGFTSQPQVVNGASNLLKAAFGPAGMHARSSVGVAELPLGSPVEIELIVWVRN